MKKNKPKIEFICENCGKVQEPNKEKSNKNWEVFDSGQICTCGGKFKLKIYDKNEN